MYEDEPEENSTLIANVAKLTPNIGTLTVNKNLDLPNFKKTTFNKLLSLLKLKFEKRCRFSMLVERDDIFFWKQDFLR